MAAEQGRRGPGTCDRSGARGPSAGPISRHRVDGRGQGTIILSAARPGALCATAAFLCDVWRGVREVAGQIGSDETGAEGLITEVIGQAERDLVDGASGPALDLLAGSLLLCGPETSPAVRYWVEATAGPAFRAHPVPAPFPGWNPASIPFDEMPRRRRSVLDSCPDWLDHSPLTYELAEEILLREGSTPPEPSRDAGAYRYLFEHHLRGQLEHYRRMLFWMAVFWQASGDIDLGQSALSLASQLSDAQHIVPAHPFTIALTTRSLAVAQENLRRGIDPRPCDLLDHDPPARALTTGLFLGRLLRRGGLAGRLLLFINLLFLFLVFRCLVAHLGSLPCSCEEEKRKRRSRAPFPTLGPTQECRSGLRGSRPNMKFFFRARPGLRGQPSRRRLRLCQSLPVGYAPRLGILTLGGFLISDRRTTGELVEVGGDPGEHPGRTGEQRDVPGDPPCEGTMPGVTIRSGLVSRSFGTRTAH